MTTESAQPSTDALVERLFDSGLKAFELLTVYVGDRLGLYKALAVGGPGTPGEIAKRTGLNGRYVREWLEQQAVAAILTVNDSSLPEDERVYSLPPEHAEALVNPDSPYSIAPLARISASFGSVIPDVLEAFRGGGGIGWEALLERTQSRHRATSTGPGCAASWPPNTCRRSPTSTPG